MIKGRSEVSRAAIDHMMQPHDHWDNYSSVALRTHSLMTCQKPALELKAYKLTPQRQWSLTNERELNKMKLLLECAVAITADNLGEAHRLLLELAQMASPYGTSCAERVVAYFAKAMMSRVINSWLGICSPLINHKSIHSTFHVFNSVSPFIKFAHFTSNQAILGALQCRDRVHIIDLDIMQGLQWPALFHILANRLEGPPYLRMTGFGASMDLLVETERRLSNFARRVGMSFEFHPVAKNFGEIDIGAWSKTSPTTAGPPWTASWGHSTIFQPCLIPSGRPFHVMTLEGTKWSIALSIGKSTTYWPIAGPARSGKDKFQQWRSKLAMRSCFVQVPMSSNAVAQAQLILNMFPPAHGYSLVQGDGTLRLIRAR
ncbi:hypothetical protein SLEP1_g833 [Rubroshorea leprosula]|uniref:Uncharacterized protein n=1 Tax=Rubroshorea leprosula TaxID=152421 RepID=A0AAV5HMQ6_9ROSI|nr:hypothetical protein SLEP1_g833 [Rubroshorea leprosula]